MVRQLSIEPRCKMRPRPMARCMYACEESRVHKNARPTQASLLPTTSKENQSPCGHSRTWNYHAIRLHNNTSNARHGQEPRQQELEWQQDVLEWILEICYIVLIQNLCLFALFQIPLSLNPAPFDTRQGTPCPNERNMWSCLCLVHLPQHIDAYVILHDSLVTSTSLAGFELMFI